jgi:hypothetical protein
MTHDPRPGYPPVPARRDRGGDRRHHYPARSRHVFVRLSDEEYDDLSAAAARVDLTTTGYVAEAALAAARATTPAEGQPYESTTRAELAHLQRQLLAARTALTRLLDDLDQAFDGPHTTARTHPLDGSLARLRRVLDQVDVVIGWIDGRLR